MSDPPPAPAPPSSEPANVSALHFSAHASYLNVINHVIASLRPVFFQEGAGELELDMLKKTWMLKIEQAGIAPAPGATATPAITHAAAVPPNSGSEPGTVPQSAPLSSAAPDTSAHALAAATQPSEEPQKEAGAAAAAAAGTKRKREDEDAGGEGAAATAAAEDDDGDGDGDDLNSDDDDDDDEAALATKDLLLAQYESVHHAKGKWRIALKAGVVHVNGRDVPFSTAKAELQF